MVGFVSIVGAGPGNPELLTLAGQRRLARGDVIIADYLVNPLLLLHCRPDAVIHQRVAGPRHGARLDQATVNAMLVEHGLAGRHVVRLKGGDPCMFGRGGEEAQVLAEHGIPFEFIPGVTSPIAAAEAAGIPVTHRDHTPAVTFVSGFEAYEKAGLQVAWQHLAQSAGTLVFLMGIKNVAMNLQRLVDAGRAADTPAAAVRWGTRGIQRTVVGTVSDLAHRIERAGLRPPAIIVVGDVVRLRQEIEWFDQRPLFGRRIVVTQPWADAGALVDRLIRDGADVVAIPCLHIAELEARECYALAAAIERKDEYDGLILSSARGVKALFRAIDRAGYDIRRLAGHALAVIGPATAAACRAHGLVPDVIPDDPRSEGLVAALGDRDWLGRRWLHVRGPRGRDLLERAIVAAGGEYRLAQAYEVSGPPLSETNLRTLLPADEGGEGVDWIIFSSGFAAEHFCHGATEVLGAAAFERLQQEAAAIVIGPATKQAVTATGFRVAAVATEPSEQGLLAAAVQLAASAKEAS